MRFRILGPLEVEDDDGRLITIGGPQLRGLLGVLLLHPNRVVSSDRLVEHVWGGDSPTTARGLLQGRIAHLRRAIQQHDRQPLATRAPGYQLEVRPGERDLDTFDDLVRAASDDTEHQATRSERLDEALALWRGPVLDGVAMDGWRAELAHLEERRLDVLEQRVELDLALGRHAALVGELQTHTHQHPLRERLWGQLLVALAGAGRTADALAAYRELRRTFVDQLGTEPSPAVQQIHQRVLTGDIASAGVAPQTPKTARPTVGNQTIPAQLPAATGAFSGRAEAFAWLESLLAAGTGDGSTIGVLSGTAGVGKTTLAVRWAHRVRARFPDGQLYLNLRGYAVEPPVRVIDALAGFLQALGVPGEQIPTDVGAATARYQAAIAGRRLMIVLDNVRTAEQVRPLLPEGPDGGGCLVLVTSRGRLTGLVSREGARQLKLDVFEPAEANELLAKLLGPDRIAAEPEAAAELARQCAMLPLALRIAAANLCSASVASITHQVASLAADNRLDVLQTGDDQSAAVRGTFDLSYDTLDSSSRRLFRHLGLAPGADVTAGSAAALAGIDEGRASALLERLANASLVEETTAGRYASHDLLRAYAKDRANDEETVSERRQAIERLLAWYLDVVDGAARALYPQLLRLHEGTAFEHADRVEAWRWLDSERAALIAAVERAYELELYEPAWLLADSLRGYFYLRRMVVDWLKVAELGLAAAEAAGSPIGRAAGHASIGLAQLCANNYWQALSHQRTALDLYEQANWQVGKAHALTNLAVVQQELGELERAVERHEQALAINTESGAGHAATMNLYNLGQLNTLRGRLDEAVEWLETASRRPSDVNSIRNRALGANRLGDAFRYLGRFDDALNALADSLALWGELDNHHGQGIAHGSTAAVHCDIGDLDAAYDHAKRALTLLGGVGDRGTEAFARNRLGEVLRRLGRTDEALHLHERAVRLARDISARFHEADSLICLADALREHGDPATAAERAAEASALAGRIGYRILEGNAEVSLASACLRADRGEDALLAAERAGALHAATGHRLGAVRALLLRGYALRQLGRHGEAADDWQRAYEVAGALGIPEQGEALALMRSEPTTSG